MNRFVRPLSLVLLVSALTFGACAGAGGSSSGGGSGSSGGGSGSSGGGASNGSMTATIGYPDGGTSDAGIAGTFTAKTMQNTNMTSGVSVIGIAANNDTISLVLYSLKDAGTYPVQHFTNTEATYGFAGQTGGIAESGEINVTAYDSTHITGTFHFIGKIKSSGSEKLEVTNGQFSANF